MAQVANSDTRPSGKSKENETRWDWATVQNGIDEFGTTVDKVGDTVDKVGDLIDGVGSWFGGSSKKTAEPVAYVNGATSVIPLILGAVVLFALK